MTDERVCTCGHLRQFTHTLKGDRCWALRCKCEGFVEDREATAAHGRALERFRGRIEG